MSEILTTTDEKRIGIVLKGQENYLPWSTEKYYKLKSKGLWKYVTGDATVPNETAPEEDKTKYNLEEAQAFWLIYESVDIQLRSYIEQQTSKQAWKTLKGLYAKVGWVSHHLGLEALIDTHLGSDSLEEYCTKYKAAAEQTKQLSEEIGCTNPTCSRPKRNGVTDTQITGIFLRNLGDRFQNFRDSKITPGRKENTPPALNDLIAELLGLERYKEAQQSANDPSALSLRGQPTPTESHKAHTAAPGTPWCEFHESSSHWTRDCRTMKLAKKRKSKKRRLSKDESSPPDQSDD
jgi:gag-polypeptide of LTR copia-type